MNARYVWERRFLWLTVVWRHFFFLLIVFWKRLQFLFEVVKDAYDEVLGSSGLGWLNRCVALLILLLGLTLYFQGFWLRSATFWLLNLVVAIMCLWNLIILWRALLGIISGETFELILKHADSVDLRYSSAIREAASNLMGDRDADRGYLRALRAELLNDLKPLGNYVPYASLIVFVFHFTIAVLLASLLAYGATLHFRDFQQLHGAFKGINIQEGQSFLRHVYYVVVTTVTVGYGEICPACGNYGSYFGILLCVQAVGLLVFGAPAVLSVTFYLIYKLPRDVDNYMKTLGVPE